MNTLYFKTRQEWRTWLQSNHDIETEVWLIFFKKDTGKPSLDYEAAVEEALCFGWIDSTVRRIDEEKFKQRYTPRHMKSIWSDTNVKRAEKMIMAGSSVRVTKARTSFVLSFAPMISFLLSNSSLTIFLTIRNNSKRRRMTLRLIRAKTKMLPEKGN